jgi:hypothetical protein
MSPLRPLTQLETHDVVNQPPQAAVAAAGGSVHTEQLTSFGAQVGSSEVQDYRGMRLTDRPGFVAALAGSATDVLTKRAMPLAWIEIYPALTPVGRVLISIWWGCDASFAP